MALKGGSFDLEDETTSVQSIPMAAQNLDPASSGAGQILGITAETALDNSPPRPWMNRVVTEFDEAFEDIQSQVVDSQIPNAGDIERESQNEEIVIEDMEHMSPITRGVWGWIEDTDFGYPPS
ncbi:peroxin 8 [Apiospora arundinis]